MTARYGRPRSYWDDREKAGTAGAAYRRHQPGEESRRSSAVERERRDLVRALQLVPDAGRVLGAAVELLDAVARTVSRTEAGQLMATAARRAGGLLLDVAHEAQVPVTFPEGPVHDDSDLDRKGSMQLMREQRAEVERAERMTSTRRLRGGITRAAAHLDNKTEEQDR